MMRLLYVDCWADISLYAVYSVFSNRRMAPTKRGKWFLFYFFVLDAGECRRWYTKTSRKQKKKITIIMKFFIPVMYVEPDFFIFSFLFVIQHLKFMCFCLSLYLIVPL